MQLKLLENSFVISKSDIKYQWQCTNFKALGLEPPTLFPAAASCEESHINIIKMAKEKHLPYITIFEDDAQPSVDAVEQLQKIENQLDKIWNAVGIVTLGYNWLGWHNTPNETPIFNYFLTNNYTVAGSHALFIKAEAYDDRLKSLTTPSASLGYDYMKDDDVNYNYADRFSQDQFNTLLLTVKEKIFAQYDLIKKLNYNIDNDTRFFKYFKYGEITDQTGTRDPITVEDMMSHSFVISLNEKRLSIFNKVFTKNKLLPLPTVWPGFDYHIELPVNVQLYETAKNSPKYFMQSIGCSASHISIVKMAKYLDWPYVCIFEDDAYPCIDVYEKLTRCLSIIPIDCTSLMLGHYWINCPLWSQNFYKLTSDAPERVFMGAHAYIIFREGYDQYIDIVTKTDWVADHAPGRMHESYSVYQTLFIQYNYAESSMTISKPGYVWAHKKEEDILKEFPKFEDYLI